MSTGAEMISATDLAWSGMRRRIPWWENLLRFCQKKPLGAVGGLILLVMILAAVFAPIVAPYDPYEMHYDKLFTAPGSEFILGSDNFGRDLLSRIIYGSQVSLIVGFASVILSCGLGAIIGVISGYFGGKTDMYTQRFMDILQGFPTLVLALSIVAALGASLLNVIIAISITNFPRAQRVTRSSTLSIKESQYIDAAKAIGASNNRILYLHILPNTFAPWLIFASNLLGQAILLEATLSFLGLGVPPPIPSWGGMLSGAGREFVEKAPWMAIYPGIAISAAVFGFGLLGDAIRDVLDPRLR